MDEKWNLGNVPPEGHKDVPEFAYSLFEIAKAEKDRLGKPKDFLSNYALYRGRATGANGQPTSKINTPINFYFANVERTVSNITARQPVGEVVDLDGADDDGEKILSAKIQKWWSDTKQQTNSDNTARTMEIYGIAPEKPCWDKSVSEPQILLTDPFAFFPAPGNWGEHISTEAPYVCYVYLDFISKIEKDFEVKDVAKDEAYELLGMVREEYKAPDYTQGNRTGNYSDPMTKTKAETTGAAKIDRGLIIEVWLRDDRVTIKSEDVATTDRETGMSVLGDDGQPVFVTIKEKVPAYPDGIRKITITHGKKEKKKKLIVLDDCANPNINSRLDVALASTTYPWGRLPCYYANSYKDLVSIWGFSAAEQVGDLLMKINRIVSKLVAYVLNVMAPPLIVQKNCGITRQMIETSLQSTGRLVLMPTTPKARIEFMQIPNLPATFFQVLDLIIKLFDRIYQIEDADRGQAPSGVIAASAIVALQERNQVLMQAKTRAIELIVEERSRWAIGLWQNWGIKSDVLKVNDEPTTFIGTNYAGRKFGFVVEAGSTTPRTALQREEQAKWLYSNKAIGQRGLLEALNWEGWQEEIERTAESMLDQALEVLIDAGMPEEEAVALKQYLSENQGGPGDTKSKQKEKGGSAVRNVRAGVPKSKQGGSPPQ